MGTSCDPVWAKALDILRATPSLSKRRQIGAPVTTKIEGPSLLPPHTWEAAVTTSDPDRETLQAVIWALDLIAAGRPDLQDHPFDPEVQQIAGKLRERFSRRYKTSAYAEARATKKS